MIFNHIAVVAVVLFALSVFGCSTTTELKVQSSNADLGNQTIDLHRTSTIHGKE